MGRDVSRVRVGAADSIFHDPYARRMAGNLGDSIVCEVPRGESMAWAVIVRTAVPAWKIPNLGANMRR